MSIKVIILEYIKCNQGRLIVGCFYATAMPTTQLPRLRGKFKIRVWRDEHAVLKGMRDEKIGNADPVAHRELSRSR